MLTKISNWLLKISSTWLMIASLLLMVFFMAFILPAQAVDASRETGSDRSPDTTFYYSPEDLYQMADEYGTGGRQAYILSRWTFDLAFPFVYTAFLAIGTSWFIQQVNGRAMAWKLTNLIPILGGIFDLLENIATTQVMSIFPARSEVALLTASLVTPIKWVLVCSSFIPYFVFGAAWLIQRLQTRKR